MKVKLVDWNVKLEEAISHAGSVCYDSDPTDVSRVTRLKSMGHLSCFRNAFAAFEISGISRACADQIRTHQTLNHLMRSMRYCDESNLDFVTPTLDYLKDDSEEAKKLIETHVVATEYVYQKLRELKVRKEDCRSILPMNTSTKMYVSGNIQGFLHFINLRTSKKAQKEIQDVAKLIEEALLKKFPLTFGE